MSDAEAAVLTRGRRSTAGRRMGVLVGEALENDDAFWSHSTWMEDEDKRKYREKNKDDDSSEISSADESFDLDEEPEENRVDVFDSDFDESESEESEGSDNEQAVLREEKQTKQAAKKKSVKLSAFSRKRKASVLNKKKLMGSEHNAGLILKLPCDIANDTSTAVSTMPPPTPSMTLSIQKNIIQPIKPATDKLTLAATRSRRVTKKPPEPEKEITTSDDASKKKATNRKRKFTQEELLLESIRETEPANERWLLGRRRVEALSDLDEKKKAERLNGSRDFKVILKYHSLKGCYNTLTFPDMDHVPDMFRRKTTDIDTTDSKSMKNNSECIITGKKARYRDPLTGESYYDLEAFRELRRRYNAGLPLDQHIEECFDDNENQCNTKPPSSNDSNRSHSPSHQDDNMDNENREIGHIQTQTFPDNIQQYISLPHDNELGQLSTEDYNHLNNTNTNLSSIQDDDIGDSKDIDIDNLFDNDSNRKTTVHATNTITAETNDSNNDVISSIVTPPQTFNNSSDGNDFADAASANVSSKRSFEKGKTKSTSTSSNSHVSSHQVLIAS